MPFVTSNDGTQIYYKDWGSGQPILATAGRCPRRLGPAPMFFLNEGYRVIGVDRRGHGRSEQVADGHDMDHYADDLAAVVNHLDLHDAIHVGHSTGGGEVTRYIGRHGESRVARAVLISAVPPIMVQSDKNPQGTPRRSSTTSRRSWRPTAPASTGTSRPARSMASTDRASSRRRLSSRTGGARA